MADVEFHCGTTYTAAMKHAICCGYICCDIMATANHYPEENQKQFIDSLDISVGGPAANAACLLAKWGIATTLIGQLGNDQFSEVVLNDLHRCNVNTEFIQRYNGPCNCAVIISNDQTGTRTVLSRNFSREFGRHPLLSRPPGEGMLFDGHQYEWSLALLEKFEGVSVLDAGSFRDETKSLLNRVSDPVTSAPFFEKLSGSLQHPSEIHDLYQHLLVVTNGEKPVIVHSRGKCEQHTVFKVHAKDTLAAGDCFHGAYLFARMHACTVSESILLASAASAICVTRRGGYHSLPFLDETIDFLKKNTASPVAWIVDKLSAANPG